MRLEPIANPSTARRLGLPALALVATLAVAMTLALIAGADPMATLGQIATGALGSKLALLETLNRATPLIFTGLAVAVAFRAKLWNNGAEAQLYAGAIMAVVLGTGVIANPLVLPLSALAAMLAGAALLLGPVLLKTRLGVDEVVTTLLLNFIMLLFVSYLLEGPMKDPMGMGWPKSTALIPEARLPSIVEGLRLHWGFALALIAAALVWVIQTRTTLGFEIRAVGQNPAAARFAGMPVNAVLVKTALMSGGLAALAGWSEVAGLKGHLSSDLSPGFGYTGIIVAMLALLHPLGVILTAIFVAGIFVGSDAMSRTAGVPTYIADMLMATALLFMVLVGMLFGLLQSILTVPFGLSQHVVGLGVTLLATSSASFTYRLMLPEVTSPPKIEPFQPLDIPILSDLPWLGEAIFQQTALTWAAFAVAGIVAFALFRTPLGLAVRAVGDNPAAVEAQGLSVNGLRMGAVMVGSGLMAVGGAFLTLSAFSSFFFEMVNGRGWICIELVVFGAWKPGKALLGAIPFAAFDALQIRLQQTELGAHLPYQLFLALPFILSILALILMSRRAEVPAALMVPYNKGER